MSERCPGPGKAKEPWLLAGAPARERAIFRSPQRLSGSPMASRGHFWPHDGLQPRPQAHFAACERGLNMTRAAHTTPQAQARLSSARAGQGQGCKRARTRAARAGLEVEVELGDVKSSGEDHKDCLCARFGLREEQLHLRGGGVKCRNEPELPPEYAYAAP